jgi:hypothetical protein
MTIKELLCNIASACLMAVACASIVILSLI